jgi:Ca2+-binding EF-hand superfamily protein
MNMRITRSIVLNRRPVLNAVCASTLIALAVSLAGSLSAQEDEGWRRDRGGRRQFDPTRFLDRADRNQDGKLDEQELGGRLRQYVEELGVDTSRPVTIGDVQKAYQAKQERDAAEARARAIDESRQVPKFGSAAELPPPADFTVTTAVGAGGRLEDQYESEMVDTVRAYMRRYDENEDGWLDEDESRRIRRILGEEADSDGNGKLGEMEVAAALQQRMNRRETGDREPGDRRGRFSGRFSGDRGDSPRSPERGPRVSQESRDDSSPATSSRRPALSLSERRSVYVDGLLRRYDEDGNGSLSEEERKKISGSVRLRLVDMDGDGEVDRREALDSLSDETRPQASAAPEESSPRRRRRSTNDDSRDQRRSTPDDDASRTGGAAGPDIRYDLKGFRSVPITRDRRTDIQTDLERRGADRNFLSRDKNSDGQISMGEFRDGRTWTDELVRQFGKLDENGDGVVTLNEFKANYRDRDIDD